MNLQSYYEARFANPNFDKEKVINIDIHDILTDDHEKNNEVRSQGLNPKTFKETKHQIKEYGTNYVPIDVDPLPGGQYKPHDGGGNRLRALRDLYEETGDERFKTIRAVKCSYSTRSDRAFGMLNENLPMFSAHEASQDDIVLTIHKCITEHLYFGSDYSEIDIDDIKEVINTKLNRDLHWNTVNALAKKIYNKLPHASSKYYRPVDDTEIVSTFNEINPFGIKLPDTEFMKGGKYNWGTIVEDKHGQKWAVYCGKQLTWTKQNIVHYSLFKKAANPDVKVMTILYNGNVRTTKNAECPVQNFRKNAHNNLIKLDSEHNKYINGTLVDYDVYLPQIVKGKTQEDMNSLYDHEGEKIEKEF